MTDAVIPDDVKRFIADHIESAEQLDALVLLHTQREREWTAEAVSQAIYTVPQSAERTLRRLEEQGFAATVGGTPEAPAFRYAPADADTDRRVGQLAAAYRTNRVEVVKHLFASRVDPVKSFADAFRLRKDR